MAGDRSNAEIVNLATAAGVPVGDTFKLLHARARLKPEAPETFYDASSPHMVGAGWGSGPAGWAR